jgi:photosystem II stability/assembly factor-like uncharacterized protein
MQGDLPTLVPTLAAASPTDAPKAISPTPRPVCTPPPCASDETYACGAADGCPGGCGTICVRKTPDPNAPTPTSTGSAGGPVIEPIARLTSGAITVTTISMLNERTGWAVAEAPDAPDAHFMRTQDGGATWRDISPPQPQDEAAEIGQGITFFALDERSAWVTYYNRTGGPLFQPANVWRTTDGGQTWQASAPLDLTDVEMYLPSDLYFIDASTGWLMAHVGAGMSHDYVNVYRTTDGGQTWARLVDPYTDNLQQSCAKTGLIFTDANTGWVTGDCFGVQPGAPYLYRTADGGQTWASIELPAPESAPELFSTDTVACGVQAPAYFDDRTGLLPVECLDFNAGQPQTFLYRTSDAGQNWTAEPLTGDYQSADFLNATTGWVLTNSGPETPSALFATSDGAATLNETRSVNWTGRFSFVSPQVGWAVAESAEGKALVQTTDGGRTWREIKPVVAP